MKESINNPFYRGSPFADKVDTPVEHETTRRPFTRCCFVERKNIALTVEDADRNLCRKVFQKLIDGIYNLVRR